MILSSATLTGITEKPSIFEDVDFNLGTDSTSFPLADKLRIANISIGQIGTWIWQSTGTWNFDDSNSTDLPIANTDLVDDQDNYTLPTDLLAVRRVEVKNTAGDYVKLELFDENQVYDGLDNDTKGFPTHYRLVGRSIILVVRPDATLVTATDGLRVYLDRTMTLLTNADAGETPGFVEPFHDLVTLMICSRWCLGKLPEKKGFYDQEIAIKKEELRDLYSKGAKEERPKLKGRYVNYE